MMPVRPRAATVIPAPEPRLTQHGASVAGGPGGQALRIERRTQSDSVVIVTGGDSVTEVQVGAAH